MAFNPSSSASPDSGIFGLPHQADEAKLILIPVPWEPTTSYRKGTKNGPEAVLRASHQVDLFDIDFGRIYEPGIHMRPLAREVADWNEKATKIAQAHRDSGGDGPCAEANLLGTQLNDWVKRETEKVYQAKRIPGIVGGDHSVPFGAIQAAAKLFPAMGILHIDAHADLREAYEGFQWSHASIFHNVMEKIPLQKLVQVGIRDFSEEEEKYRTSLGARAVVYHDARIADAKHAGKTWKSIVERIVSNLPKEVWISFDIDGMDPRFCPSTGTPVPGGLDFNEIRSLFLEVVKTERKIIGFDLNEVAPSDNDEWDANVGARVLYKLCGASLASQGHIPLLLEH